MLPSISKGMVTKWSGSIVSIPSGWALCDGNNGTPDLTDKFIPGAGDTYNPDATGGAVNHNHLLINDGHTHGIGGGASLDAGSNKSSTTDSNYAAGYTDNQSERLPFYALAYIMKL